MAGRLSCLTTLSDSHSHTYHLLPLHNLLPVPPPADGLTTPCSATQSCRPLYNINHYYPNHNHITRRNGFPNGVLQRLLPLLRPSDCRERRLLLAIVPPGRPRKGRHHRTSTLAIVILGLIILLVQQRLLPRPRNQLLSVQGGIHHLASSPLEPLPLLPHRKRQLLCTTHSHQAITPAKPDSLIITLLARLFFIIITDSIGHLATSSHAAQQLRAVV